MPVTKQLFTSSLQRSIFSAIPELEDLFENLNSSDSDSREQGASEQKFWDIEEDLLADSITGSIPRISKGFHDLRLLEAQMKNSEGEKPAFEEMNDQGPTTHESTIQDVTKQNPTPQKGWQKTSAKDTSSLEPVVQERDTAEARSREAAPQKQIAPETKTTQQAISKTEEERKFDIKEWFKSDQMQNDHEQKYFNHRHQHPQQHPQQHPHQHQHNDAIPMHDKTYYEKQGISQVDYSCDHESGNQSITIHHLPDSIMIKIFSYLKMPVLIKISRACKTWRRLSLDMELWAVVDLAPFRYKLNDYKIVHIIRFFLFGSIRKLCLAEFSISTQILRELAKCKTLRSLNLDSCTFVGKFIDNWLVEAFPVNLNILNMRHTSGAKSVMNVICPRLVSVREFHASNKVIDSCDIVQLFSSLCSIRILKISNSVKIDKTALQLMALHCNDLRCLSLKHCRNFTGEGLQELIKACPGLEEISFNGTELQDRFIMNVDWRKATIRKLEISWCRNITDKGLQSIICQLNDLEYLKVCSCGNGHALSDKLMHFMASSTALAYLEEIEFSFSRDLTDEGILTLTRNLRSLKYLTISNCNQLSREILAAVNMFITVSFSFSNLDEFTNYGRGYFRRAGGRSYS